MELGIWQSETHQGELAKTRFTHPPAFLEFSRKSIHWKTQQSQAIELDEIEVLSLNYLDHSGIDHPYYLSYSYSLIKHP
jgi:hypothetical protein